MQMRVVKGFMEVGMVALVVLGFSLSALAKDKFELEFEKDQEAVKLVRDTKAGGYEVIGAEDFKKLIDSKKDILIVDTMPYEDSYKKEHVPGAKQFLFPVPIMQNWDSKETGGKSMDDFAAFLGPDKDKTIVFYCGFVKCTRSHNAAAFAKKLGYKNVYRFPGGIFAWKGGKYPVEAVK
jgi:thiosulfate/3-mercaptopyruvate sulfurtransferase